MRAGLLIRVAAASGASVPASAAAGTKTSGASTITCWPCLAVRIRSTIWSRGWASSTVPHSGQWAVPTRVYSTRRKSWISVIVATVDRAWKR